MLFSLLELASNKALQYDVDGSSKLKKLQGKTMALHIQKLDLTISVTPQSEGLELSNQPTDSVDVTLSATPGALIKISRDGLENAELEPGELEISGDPIVGQRFAQVMSDLNIDWESMLADQIGDAPAKTVSFVATQTKEFAVESRSRLHEFVSDLIQNDMKVAANKDDVERFLDSVDNIRADTDRLAAKLERLKIKIDNLESNE